MRFVSSEVIEDNPNVRIHITVMAGEEEGEPNHAVQITAHEWPSGTKFLDKRYDYTKH